MVNLKDVQNNSVVKALIDTANHYLEVKGYTEHGQRHVGYVSATAGKILSELNFPDREVELAKITGWVHDVGNAVNREHHGITGAVLVMPILKDMGMDIEEIMKVITAIGNHEEGNGIPVNAISAAIIIADKSDAHRTRVRKDKYDPNDIHDRVNYSIKNNNMEVDSEKKVIRIKFEMDTNTSSVMEYLQIYLSRMRMSESAANFLGCTFELVINNVIINNHNYGLK